jgi:hypothetical protein
VILNYYILILKYIFLNKSARRFLIQKHKNRYYTTISTNMDFRQKSQGQTAGVLVLIGREQNLKIFGAGFTKFGLRVLELFELEVCSNRIKIK